MARVLPGEAANPAPPTVQRIRVRFAKRGRLRFLSHRDVARSVERAVRRAGIPVSYSHGFSPHPRLSWIGAAPTGSRAISGMLPVLSTIGPSTCRLPGVSSSGRPGANGPVGITDADRATYGSTGFTKSLTVTAVLVSRNSAASNCTVSSWVPASPLRLSGSRQIVPAPTAPRISSCGSPAWSTLKVAVTESTVWPAGARSQGNSPETPA